MKTLVLDAMGVLYSVGDDVNDLLVPFIAENGGTRDVGRIGRLYRKATLGSISAAAFWLGVELDPMIEDEYLSRHRTTLGLFEFVQTLKQHEIPLWGLSNDVSEWSRKLRARFGLEDYFRGFVVSGDAGKRKPDPAIFRLVSEHTGAQPHDILFIDDSRKNVDAAATLGWQTVLFIGNYDSYRDPNPDPPSELPTREHVVARTFNEVLAKPV